MAAEREQSGGGDVACVRAERDGFQKIGRVANRAADNHGNLIADAFVAQSLIDRGERQLLQGELTSPIDPKPGCRFAARCPYATEICRQESPSMTEPMPNHFVACHHVKEINQL